METQSESFHTNKRSAASECEEIVFKYVQKKDGDKKYKNWQSVERNLFTVEAFQQLRDNLEVGHYVVKEVDGMYNLTVWQKKKVVVETPGRIWGVHKTEKLVWVKLFKIGLVTLDVNGMEVCLADYMTSQNSYQTPDTVYVRLYEDSDDPPYETDDSDDESSEESSYDSDYDSSEESDDFSESGDRVVIKFPQRFLNTVMCKRLKRLGDNDRDVSIVKMREEFPYEFIRCPLAGKFEESVIPPMHNKLVADIKDQYKKLGLEKPEHRLLNSIMIHPSASVDSLKKEGKIIEDAKTPENSEEEVEDEEKTEEVESEED